MESDIPSPLNWRALLFRRLNAEFNRMPRGFRDDAAVTFAAAASHPGVRRKLGSERNNDPDCN